MANPKILDAYLRHRVLTDLAEVGVEMDEIGSLADVETDEEEILRPVIDDLDDTALRHFVEAQWEENVYEATVPLWNAFDQRVVNVEIEDVG